MRRLLRLIALAMLLAMALAGCSRFFVDWDKRTIRRTPDEVPKVLSPAPVPPRAQNVAPRTQSTLLYKRKHKPVVIPPPDMKEMTVEPDTTQTSPPPPAQSPILLATPGGNSDAAAKEIDVAGQRLAHFDRNRLSAAMLATYDQANGFLIQGKQALAEKDYVAASGFAQKASVLVDRLQATVTAR